MKTSIFRDDGLTWRLSSEAVAVFAGLLISFGIATLLIVFSSGAAASVMTSTAQYAYWAIGFGIVAGVALVIRQLLTLERWLRRE